MVDAPLAPVRPSAAASARDRLAAALLLLALLVLASRLATLLHEALGHALPAALLGADVTGMRISLFGGGWTAYDFGDAAPSAAARAAVALGGIAVNLLTGAAALAVAPRLARRPALALAASLFGFVSLLGAAAYAALGFFHGVGDPAACAGRSPGPAYWIPWLAAVPAAAWFALRRHGAIQEGLWPAGSRAGRLRFAALTLGAALAAYAGLFALEGAPLVAADAENLAHRRAAEEARARRFEETLARVRAAHPGMAEEELRRHAEAEMTPVRPEDVPRPFPLAPVLAALALAGGTAGLAGASPAPDTGPPPALRSAARAAALASVVLAVLALLRRA